MAKKKYTIKQAKKFHSKRSLRARSIDEALKAKKAPNIEYWFKHYNRSDLPEIDMPKTLETRKITVREVLLAAKKYTENGGVKNKQEYRKTFYRFIKQELKGIDKVTMDEKMFPKGEKFIVKGSVHPYSKTIIIKIQLKDRLKKEEFYKLNNKLKKHGWEYIGSGAWRKKWG